jgi:small conductance mechanosensitive channel
MTIDLSIIWRTTEGLFTSFLGALPRIGVACVVMGIFYVIARGVRSLARQYALRRAGERTLELAMGRLAQSAILLIGVLFAAVAAFPSFTPADLVSTLGIGGVAIGFAFKDIFQNFLAGILILVTRPFRVGDQIVYKEYEGAVEDIQTRATYIKTYDGRRVIIPNSELYTNAVTINTAFTQRRWQYDFGIGYGDDIETARGIILQVLRDADGVSPDPKADVVVVALANSTVNLRARWWGASYIADGLKAQDRVLTAAKQALTAAGIDLPFPTQQILFHDQTEAGDGDRRRQREGWSSGGGDTPTAAGIARALAERGVNADHRPDGAGER